MLPRDSRLTKIARPIIRLPLEFASYVACFCLTSCLSPQTLREVLCIDELPPITPKERDHAARRGVRCVWSPGCRGITRLVHATFAEKAAEWLRRGLLLIFRSRLYGTHHAPFRQRFHLSGCSDSRGPLLLLLPSSRCGLSDVTI